MFSVISFNIRSMNKNFEEFKDFIISLNHEFSVISLTETWCLDDPKNKTLFKLDNYTSMHQARNDNRNGGGTCFFIHNSLTLIRGRIYASITMTLSHYELKL